MSSYGKEKEAWLDSKTRLKGYREVKYGYRVAISFWCMRPSLVRIIMIGLSRNNYIILKGLFINYLTSKFEYCCPTLSYDLKKRPVA